MMKRLYTVIVILAIAPVGCATTGTKGVVNIGPDLYMVGGLGGFTDWSSSGVKARLYQQGAQYCSGLNRAMVPVNSTGQDAALYTYASAEIQFWCLTPDDPRARAAR